jgi:hypothetical protein
MPDRHGFGGVVAQNQKAELYALNNFTIAQGIFQWTDRRENLEQCRKFTAEDVQDE